MLHQKFKSHQKDKHHTLETLNAYMKKNVAKAKGAHEQVLSECAVLINDDDLQQAAAALELVTTIARDNVSSPSMSNVISQATAFSKSAVVHGNSLQKCQQFFGVLGSSKLNKDKLIGDLLNGIKSN